MQTDAGKDSRVERKHRRRLRENNQLGHVTRGIKRIRLEQQGYKCPVCQKGIDYKEAHLEHIIPLAKGGPHDDNNLRVTCKTCNLEKGTKVKNGTQTVLLSLLHEASEVV